MKDLGFDCLSVLDQDRVAPDPLGGDRVLWGCTDPVRDVEMAIQLIKIWLGPQERKDMDRFDRLGSYTCSAVFADIWGVDENPQKLMQPFWVLTYPRDYPLLSILFHRRGSSWMNSAFLTLPQVRVFQTQSNYCIIPKWQRGPIHWQLVHGSTMLVTLGTITLALQNRPSFCVLTKFSMYSIWYLEVALPYRGCEHWWVYPPWN